MNSKQMDFIFILGSPGSGKSTVSEILHKKLGSPCLDIGRLREIHLLPDWSNASRREEEMTFSGAALICKNYIRWGYKNILINDIDDLRVSDIPRAFRGHRYLIVTLFISDEQELVRRILDPQDDRGFRRFDAALKWNRMIMARPPFPGELRIDSSRHSPQGVAKLILAATKRPSQKGAKSSWPKKSDFFDQFRYFKENLVPPWSKKLLSKDDVNKGWRRALRMKFS